MLDQLKKCLCLAAAMMLILFSLCSCKEIGTEITQSQDGASVVCNDPNCTDESHHHQHSSHHTDSHHS